MNIQLINTPDSSLSTIEQILINRGIQEADILHYVNLQDSDINSPELLGLKPLQEGVQLLVKTIQKDESAVVLVDCDCDGYTSAALVINYLYELFPAWVKNKVDWILHKDKSHGLKDSIEQILEKKYSLVICPDSSSNDYEEHKKLQENNQQILILDHHLADHISNNAITINNQLSDYPNKELSGVGVAWQFCRYIDKILKVNYANNFLDLVALGNCGDMMSLKSFETRYLISKGLRKENIKNPFIDYMIEKNNFPLSKADYKSNSKDQACTSMGAAFFIVPFVNAITRSGTIEEKELVFRSMLTHCAFARVPEIKRNKATGREEELVLQAVRVISNVKNRQTRAEDAGMALLEQKIKDLKLLDHRFLLLLVESNEIAPEIRGLIANKFASKYQRPCAILTHTDHETYEGSMRGYTKNGLKSFKDLLDTCPSVLYVQGQ